MGLPLLWQVVPRHCGGLSRVDSVQLTVMASLGQGLQVPTHGEMIVAQTGSWPALQLSRACAPRPKGLVLKAPASLGQSK